MRPSAAEIETRIGQNLQRYFPGLSPGSAQVRCAPFAETSSYPLVHCGVFDRATSARRAGLVVKFPPTWSTHDEAETEHRQLSRMAAVLGIGGGPLRVPRPLDYFPDWSALVTEEVGGERFSRRLMRDTSRFAGRPAAARLAGWVRDCGRWLAAFHQATALAGEAPFGDAFRDPIMQRLEKLQTQGLPAAVAARVQETLGALRGWGTDRDVPVACLHGDFGPQNIHVAPEWICVFDLSYDRPAAIFDDVAYFLVTLETMSPWPRHVFFDRARALALREPFLQGYGRGTDGDDATALEGYYLKALVFRCAKQRRNVAARGRLPAAAFDRVFVARRYPERLERQCRLIQKLL
ncbi:MAG: phosphotransferase [Candidatus Krumholzibacteria bacterium]|nr:phosphotransferase [Candidatus Krumholzibacteria bacterium]MDH4336468.1 phosphotransferase [Candidatus Krumholzibacteria bacterium]MDH5269060.1 phosphotransferase [Candidatus Krumholzibacteria bacterium]